MSGKTSPQPMELLTQEETVHVEAEHVDTENVETEHAETETVETVKDVDQPEKQVNETEAQNKPDSNVCTDSSSPVKPQMTPASLAECIAKEAKLKASKFISKNVRVPEEFDGVGINVEDHVAGCNDFNESHESLHEEVEEDEGNKNAVPLTPEEIKKKIMWGAKPVMPMGDEELMKKLKEKYNKLSNE